MSIKRVWMDVQCSEWALKKKEKSIVSSGWLSVCTLLGDVGDTDIHKQHDAAMMEMSLYS